MLNPTRRDVCCGLVSTALATIGGFALTKQDAVSSSQQTTTSHLVVSPTHLNVVVHGLCAIIVSPVGSDPSKGITLVFPDIADPQHTDLNHLYMFGTLNDVVGKEFDLIKPMSPRAQCVLNGLTPGSRPQAQTLKGDIVFSGISVTTTGLRTFVLPWTNNITSVALMKRSDNTPLFADTCGAGFGSIVAIPTIHVFSYDISLTDNPMIIIDGMDSLWHLQPSSVSSAYGNMHIYAEPKHSDSQHARGAFDSLMALLGKSCLKFLPFFDPRGTVRIPDTSVPAGTSSTLDLLHLDDFFKAGETANCVAAFVFP
jgi:hypothetical protein